MGDLDITLRHVAQRMPEAFARGALGTTADFIVEGWQESQVTAVERRLDRVLCVRVARRRRWLHVEWQWEWEKGLAYRIYEYQALLAMAQRDPKRALQRAPVESTLVLLSGRQEPWPAWGRFRLSPRGERFSGARFRIDPVYQHTVDQLIARNNLLWMVFAPLVRDASPDTLGAAITAVQHLAHSRDEMAEVVTAMTVVAEYAPRERGTREWLMSFVDEGFIERSFPFKKGEARGEARGLTLLAHQFERKLRRPLLADERDLLQERLRALGPERLGDVVLDLDADALAHWLADPDAR